MKKYFITGLLVWLPLAITIWVLLWIMGVLDSVFTGLVGTLHALFPGNALIANLPSIPGLGVVTVGLGIFLTGVFVANVFGRWWVRQWDRLLSNIPVVKSIYTSVKQVSDTLFSSSGNAFREAVLVEYPRQGAWTVAFVTGAPSGEVAQRLAEATAGETFVSLYVPTTPNPTSGFFIMVPRTSVRPLSLTVDEALTYIISMGVVAPAPAAGAPDA